MNPFNNTNVNRGASVLEKSVGHIIYVVCCILLSPFLALCWVVGLLSQEDPE